MNIKIIKKVPQLKLGEGLFWDYEFKKLWFVDIEGHTLFALDIYTYVLKSWSFKEKVCWVVPTYERNEVIVGLQNGVIKFDIKSNKRKWIVKNFPNNQNLRLNDVGVDEKGRLWFGSMHNTNESLAVGELASFSKNEGLKLHDYAYKVTNGPVIIENNLYHNDSYEGIMYKYEVDFEQIKLKNKKVFKKFLPNEGKPDGMAVDKDENILVAMWGSGKVNRIDNSANIIDTIQLPAPYVTNICFAGENFERIFVTSATIAMSKKEKEKYPLSGCLFEVEIPGLHGKKQIKANI